MKHAGLTSQEVYKQTQAGNINYIPDTSDKQLKKSSEKIYLLILMQFLQQLQF